jgi:type II secretory pathway component HofQ
MVGRAAENRDWSNYADRTAEAVFGPRGDRECATNQPRAFAWANVEGRDLAREQVMQRQSAQKSVDRHRERGGMEIGD